MKNIEEALKVWEALGNIPINDNDKIEKDFKHFKKGTDRFDIWMWIEDSFNISIAMDLMRIK